MIRKRFVPVVSTAALALAAPAVAQSVEGDPPAPRQESALTRDLNSGPPFPVRTPPPPVETPAPVPEAITARAPTPVPERPVAVDPAAIASAPTSTPAPASSLADDLNSGPPARVASPPASAPVSRPTPVPLPAPASVPVVRAEPTPPPAPPPVSPPATIEPARPSPVEAAPPPVYTPVEAAPVPAPPAPSPVALGPAEIAALPFRVDLPPGFRIVPRPGGPDAQIYSVRRGDMGFVTVYAGPAAQFPIYDGQMVQSGGRASVIVVEDGRRHALEHLFQRAVAPHEIHIWVSSLEGADRDLAELIAQTIEAR